ncbi:hypothetical protein M2103_001985 [Ereboglobus sp. PH5-5]|nr:hypothetical protein [Ereboglobus sp. PH5-5]
MPRNTVKNHARNPNRRDGTRQKYWMEKNKGLCLLFCEMKHPAALLLSFLFLSGVAFADSKTADTKESVHFNFRSWDDWSASIPQHSGTVRLPPKVSKDVFFNFMRAFPFERDFVRVTLDKRAHTSGETSYKPLVDELEVHLRQFGFKRIVVDLAASSINFDGDGKLPVVLDTLKQRLQFTTSVTENEDRWVALPPTKPGENTFMYGFIYIDSEAGFTFHMGGSFSVTKNGAIQPHDDSAMSQPMLKSRIQRDYLVARLSPEDIKALGKPNTPDWLQYYKTDSDSIYHKVRWGWAYNHIGAYEKALTFLEPAYLLEPTNGKLLFELSYSYNALRRADAAERVLVRAVKDLPDDFFVNREYAYLLLQSKRYDKAIEQYHRCLKLCPETDLAQKSEVAFNLAQAYNQSGKPKKAAAWFKNAQKWAPEGTPVAEFFKNNPR